MTYARKYVSLALLIIVALSILPVIALTPMKAQAASDITITTSRDAWGTVYKGDEFYVDVSIVPPPSDTNITVLVQVGTSTYTINATRIGLTTTYRANLTIDTSGNLIWLYKSTAKTLTTLEDGQVITFSYGGASKSLTYTHKEPELTVRSTIPAYDTVYTSINGWKLIAPDLNSNPYKKDIITIPNITVKVYDPSSGNTYNGTLKDVKFEETDVNSGEFIPIEQTYYVTSPLGTYYGFSTTNATNRYTHIVMEYPGSPLNVTGLYLYFTFVKYSNVNFTNLTNVNLYLVTNKVAYGRTYSSGSSTYSKISTESINVRGYPALITLTDIANATWKHVTYTYYQNIYQRVGPSYYIVKRVAFVSVDFNLNVTYISSSNEYYLNITNVTVRYHIPMIPYYTIYKASGYTNIPPSDQITAYAYIPVYPTSSDTEELSASVSTVTGLAKISATADLNNGIAINVTDPTFDFDSGAQDQMYAVVQIGTGSNAIVKIVKLTENSDEEGLFQATLPASLIWDAMASGAITSTSAEVTITVTDPIVTASYVAPTYENSSKTIYVKFQQASIEDVKPSGQIVLGKGLLQFTLCDADLANLVSGSLRFNAGQLAVQNVTVLYNSKTIVMGRLILEVTVKNLTSGETYPVLMEAKYTTYAYLYMQEPGKYLVSINLAYFKLARALATDEEPVKLNIIYEDEFTPDNEPRNVTVSIPVLAPSMSVDRDFIPLTTQNNMIVKVTLTDPESNTNAYAKDTLRGTLTVNLVYFNGTAKDITANAIPATILESDIDSSQFIFNVTVPKNDIVPALIGGYLEIKYVTPTSQTVLIKDIPFKVFDAKLLVNGTTSIKVAYGQVVNVTVIDPDFNVYNSGYDTFTGAQLGISGPDAIKDATFNETGPNTGVFTAIIPAYKLGKPGDEIEISLSDPTGTSTVAGDTSWFSSDTSASITITTSTATLEVPSEHGPYGIVEIKVTDPDMNVNPDAKDTVKLYIYLNNLPASAVSPATAVETDVDTGVFVYDLNLSKLGSPADLIGSTITVMYIDEYNPSGQPVTLSKSVKIISWDGEIEAYNASGKVAKYFDLGAPINITVKDPDANADPNKVDTVWVLVKSSSSPIMKNITLYETGPDTGVFSNVIRTTDNFTKAQQPKYLYAKYGDTITIKYEDQYPADYASTHESKWFEYTVTIGVPIEKPIVPSQPKIVDMNGQPTTPKVGKTMIVTYNLSNTGYEEMTFTVLFIVRNAQGVPVAIQMQQVTLPAGASQTVGFGFTPTAAGTYTVEIHVIKSLSQPETIGEQVTQQITVTQ